MDKDEIIEGIVEKGAFSFVADNYWKMDKDQLKQICMELDYAAYVLLSSSEYEELTEHAIETLKESWDNL